MAWRIKIGRISTNSCRDIGHICKDTGGRRARAALEMPWNRHAVWLTPQPPSGRIFLLDHGWSGAVKNSKKHGREHGTRTKHLDSIPRQKMCDSFSAVGQALRICSEAALHSVLHGPALVPEADQRGTDPCAVLYNLHQCWTACYRDGSSTRRRLLCEQPVS